MLKCFKNEKLWYAVGGAAAMVIGKKIITAKKTRELAGSGKGHEAAERCKGYIPEYEGRGTGYLLRCKGKGRHRQRS